MIRATKPTITTAAARILGGPGTTEREVLVTVPSGGSTVYVGGDDVTTANGWPIVADGVFGFVQTGDDDLWAVVASGTQAISLFATRVNA